jgi:capsular polysaccharide export protein
MSATRILGVSSRGIMRIPRLAAFLDEFDGIELVRRGRHYDAVAGWGLKETAAEARAVAEVHGLPYLALEDGFLRSVGLGVTGAPPLSLVVDDLGIYYDATRPSRLETLLASVEFVPALLQEAAQLVASMRSHGIGKYNHAGDVTADELALRGRDLVVVLDQTFADLSVQYGLADERSFERMLEAALDENPGADVRVKVHPDVWSGKKRGYLAEPARRSGVAVIARDVAMMSLLAHARRVYTVSSHGGAEALIRGVPVTCFGMPWYAGWALSDDRLHCERRGRRRTLEELVAAAFLEYARYVDPITGRRSDALTTVEHLARGKRRNDANRGYTAAVGVFRWKRSHVRPYLASTEGTLDFVSSPARAVRRAQKRGGRIVVWGGTEPADLAPLARTAGVPLLRMEDGFLRSTGLGADLVPASSLVLDDAGIYFDPRTPCRLENILAATDFSPELRQRASVLRQRIVAGGITKYNYGRRDLSVLKAEISRARGPRILVPGQVEDDRSILFGAPEVRTNLGLLEAVRAACPEAFIVYKPHPDVEAGYRRGRIAPRIAAALADLVVGGASSAAVLEMVDEVHTMTSLVGFEALLRGRPVTTWGLPFYAGWGLTTDRLSTGRRGRHLDLDELVAGTLLLYPLYFDWDSGFPCEAEHLLERLARAAPSRPAGFWMRKLRTVQGWLKP